MRYPWNWDEGADEYILERADDGGQLIYHEIYRGTGLSYCDGGLPEDAMYLYRLRKRRGGKTFPASGPAMGVSSLVTRDIHEVNDRDTEATYLSDRTLISNMYYYRGYSTLEVWDEDWYYIDIPSGWRASLIVSDGEAPGGISSHFKIYIRDQETRDVIHDGEIPISNYGNVAIRCYFKLYPDTSTYVANDMTAGVGGAIISYTIKIAQFQVMQ